MLEEIVREGVTIRRPLIKTIPDNSLVLPTPVGLPLTLNLTQLYLVSCKGSAVATGLPSLADMIMGRTVPDTITVNVNMKPT